MNVFIFQLCYIISIVLVYFGYKKMLNFKDKIKFLPKTLYNYGPRLRCFLLMFHIMRWPLLNLGQQLSSLMWSRKCRKKCNVFPGTWTHAAVDSTYHRTKPFTSTQIVHILVESMFHKDTGKLGLSQSYSVSEGLILFRGKIRQGHLNTFKAHNIW